MELWWGELGTGRRGRMGEWVGGKKEAHVKKGKKRSKNSKFGLKLTEAGGEAAVAN